MPRRSVCRIELVIETHFHADFLSGHLELAHEAGAEIAFADTAETDFKSRGLAHGERSRSRPGRARDPSHAGAHPRVDQHRGVGPTRTTPSLTRVLTGDTLFVGDVGRPDLLSSIGVTKEELATKLYDSLHEQILTLPRHNPGLPGSRCRIRVREEPRQRETWSTIGEQRQTNEAVRAASREEFIELVTAGQPPAPAYFIHDAMLNRQDRPLLSEEHVPPELTVAQAMALAAADAVLLDTREAEEFARGHLPGSVNVGLGGRFAEFSGSVLDPDSLVVVVADEGRALETKNRLARIGFDKVAGYVPAATWEEDEIWVAQRLTPAEFDERCAGEGVQVVDVRNPGEFADGSIPGAGVDACCPTRGQDRRTRPRPDDTRVLCRRLSVLGCRQSPAGPRVSPRWPI